MLAVPAGVLGPEVASDHLWVQEQVQTWALPTKVLGSELALGLLEGPESGMALSAGGLGR